MAFRIATSGDDDYGSPVLSGDKTVNFTSGMTAAEMQALIDAEPKNQGGYSLYFDFGDGTYSTSMTGADLTFSRFGNGKMYIRGNTGESGAHTNQAVVLDFSAGSQGIFISNCAVPVTVSNLAINIADAATSCVDVFGCFYTHVIGCYLYGDGKTAGSSSVYGRSGSSIKVEDCYVDNTANGIFVKDNTICLSDTNVYTGTKPTYGLRVQKCGRIGRLSTQPEGLTANELATAPGVIE